MPGIGYITINKTHMIPVLRELTHLPVRCYRYAYTVNYTCTNSQTISQNQQSFSSSDKYQVNMQFYLFPEVTRSVFHILREEQDDIAITYKSYLSSQCLWGLNTSYTLWEPLSIFCLFHLLPSRRLTFTCCIR